MRHRALLLANWEYQNLQRLKGPKNDIQLIREALIHPDYGLFSSENVVVAPFNLSSQGLATSIEDFLRKSDKDDYLLIYYSGHGGLRLDNYLALCGVDTQSIDSTAFDTHQLPAWISKKGRGCPTVLVLDCCFAGQVGSKSATSTVSDAKFPDGLFVLASSGRTTSPDAAAPDLPSPFTEALAKILTDPNVRGGYAGVLTGGQVFDELCRLLPDSQPHQKIVGTQFSLARRPRPSDAVDVPGWPAQQQVETVEITVNADGVCGPWCDDHQRHTLKQFDGQRRWAIRRLTDLADGVLRQRGIDKDSLQSVQKAWECIGGNLFAAVLPEALQARIREAHSPKTRLLKLRLSFNDKTLEDYPWEYLHDDRGEFEFRDDDEQPRTLGRRPGILIERAAPALPPRTSASPVWDVLTINTYKGDHEAAGERMHADLVPIFGSQSTKYLKAGEADWTSVKDIVTESESRYLVLIAPLIRRRDNDGQAKTVRIGFGRSMVPEPDFRPASMLVKALVDAGRVFKCIVLITYTAEPGRDSYRSALILASQLAKASLGPVAFMCHEREYLEYLYSDPNARTFGGLLVRALNADKHVDQAFAWARDRIIESAGDSAGAPGLSFGIPGLYAPAQEELAASNVASSRPASSAVSLSRAKMAPRF